MTLARARQTLAATVRRRGITRIVYLHTDHFEPWRSYDGRRVLGPENARDLAAFAESVNGIEHARRLTLFTKPHLNFALRSGSDMMHATPDDKLGFIRRTDADDAIARAALEPLLATTGCQFQLHDHHENYTSNLTNIAAGTDIGTYLATPEGAALDDDRFAFAIRQKIAILERETGRRMDRWFYVHGHWALNASDHADCRITREIEMLHALGCRGDFTFPAGRPAVDPTHERPYLCSPVTAPKGYDTREAAPEPAAGAGATQGHGRFFIWASAIKHGGCSIDHYSPFVRKRGEDVPKAAEKIIQHSYLHDGTLYVKTHAHSMQPAYFNGKAPAGFPHAYPANKDMLGLVFDAASDGGADITFETASEVYDRLLASPVRDTTDMTACFDAPPHAAGAAKRAPESVPVSPATARHNPTTVAPKPPSPLQRAGRWTRRLFASKP